MGERNQQSRISSSKHRGFSQCLKEFDQQIRKTIFKHGISLPRKGSSYIKRGFNNWLIFSQEHSRTPSSDWWGAPHIFGFIPSDIWMPSRQPSEIDMDKLRDRKHLGFSGWNVTCAHRKNDRLCWWKEPWVSTRYQSHWFYYRSHHQQWTPSRPGATSTHGPSVLRRRVFRTTWGTNINAKHRVPIPGRTCP